VDAICKQHEEDSQNAADSLSRFASERLKDDHDGIQPEDDSTATLEPESITIRPLRAA